MRRFSLHISIFLLALLFLPVMFLHQKIRNQIRAVKQEVKQEILSGLPEHQLRTFHFHPNQLNELKWEHEHEFEWNGQMYDVVFIKKQGEKMVIRCWPDQKESRLKQQMRTLWARAMGENPEHRREKNRLYQFLSQLFLEQGNSGLSIHSHAMDHKFLESSSKLLKGYLSIPEIPPRFI